MANIETIVSNHVKSILNDIKRDCVKLYKQAIEDKIYIHNPTWWHPPNAERTNQFIKSVRGVVEGNMIYVYNDVQEYHYTSWINFADTKVDVSQYVAKWLEDGHHARNYTPPTDNIYHNYDGTKYLESARDLIIQKYGSVVDVDIVNNDIPY